MGVPAITPSPDIRPELERSRSPATGPFMVEMIGAHDLPAIEPAFRALESRCADPNAFAGVDFLMAASRHLPPAQAPALMTIWSDGTKTRLLGVIPMFQPRYDFGGSILRSWRHPLSALDVPLIDAGKTEAVLEASLRFLQRNPSAAAAFCLTSIPAQGHVAAAVRVVAARLGLAVNDLATISRAALHIPPSAANVSRRSKERRRQLRRLSERGDVSFQVAQDYQDNRAALETFLAIEARGWKAARGSAILLNPAEANFTRAMVWSAAQHNRIRIAEFSLDGQVIASTILLIAGSSAYLWKIAYDETFAEFSPGVLLILELKNWLFGQGELTLVDSCAQPGHPMIERLWQDRIDICDLMIALRTDRPAAYRASLAREQLRRSLRARVKSVYNRLRGQALILR